MSTTETATTPLRADQLSTDPAIDSAIDSIMERFTALQGDLEATPPQDSRTLDYAEQLKEFAALRGGATFFPYLGSGFGRGPLVELMDGRVLYDMITGIGAFPAGHGHPAIVRAQLRAALSDLVIQGNLQQNTDSAAFTQLLVDEACRDGADLKHCFLCTTGVMSGENSLKIALQKKAPAHRVLAFENCFAGRTITFSQITDKPAFREGLPECLAVDYIPFFDPTAPEASTAAALQALCTHLQRHPGQYAAMFFELVQGEGGFNLGERAFFESLMRTCRDAGVAVLVDEVQTFARTTRLFAYQHFGLDEFVDVVWIGKASQVCATLYRSEFKPRPGLLSQTFTGTTSALAAGQVVIETALRENYYGASGRLAQLHAAFVEAVAAINETCDDRLHGPYGIGGMWAFTLDAGDPKQTKDFIHHLFEHGVMAFSAGKAPARVRFLPPFLALTDADLEAIFQRLQAAVASFPQA